MIYHCIQSLAQDGYLLLFKAVPRNWLVPGMTLDSCIEFVNSCLDQFGRDLEKWGPGEQDQIARLLWINLFYQNLQSEPILKPLLVHGAEPELHVDCGDTRLMVLDLANDSQLIQVVNIVKQSEIDNYADWQLIKNNQQLIDQLNLDSNARIIIRIDHLNWFEFDTVKTTNHLHNIDYRIKLMQNYINTKSNSFRFDINWAKTPVDWLSYR